MLARIQHWTAKLLSYAGRLQLVQSILFSIANYWLHIFPFPKRVLNHVESLCRNFLWSRQENYSRRIPISWETTCNPVNAGGMNLISLKEWNKATMGKLLWNINEKKIGFG
ncbi:unnamed protein product [Vicia faba]|uniref:Uncharacterized protein n=1 Tax=Vicia faba TaxID=3906 RepID=A0AAV0ZEQ2_VICFA|nr:unnamed protein product [Vicia faba]